MLKPPAAQPLTAFCEAESLDVRPLRSVKGRDASFKLVSGDPPIPGSIWDFGITRALVTQCSDSVVRLNVPFRSDLSVKKVTQLRPNNDPEFIAREIQSYWKQCWHSDKLPNLDLSGATSGTCPNFRLFDPVISVTELDFALRHPSKNKARGPDSFSTAELAVLPPGFGIYEVEPLEYDHFDRAMAICYV